MIQDNNEAIEQELIKKEKMKSLIVYQDVNPSEFSFEDKGGEVDDELIDKSSWESCNGLKELMELHWNDLSVPEQEMLSIAFDDGLTEEQLRFIMLKPLAEMANWIRIYNFENQSKI